MPRTVESADCTQMACCLLLIRTSCPAGSVPNSTRPDEGSGAKVPGASCDGATCVSWTPSRKT
ncbi:hypothetical protein [Frigoribacterium sp. SL97]|uniref:hypothetical protein n=1 Tax=Frigoribacterium sp. SL97 TaxID=2994664 RepID=UPI00227076A1|nr:hypothetical protein [Frigoribacterium sp. SL97]WAC53508.1 hypothetical protein OVA02_03930 [Frigoribacterium sp. SL97]